MKTLILALFFSINIVGQDCKDLTLIRNHFDANTQVEKELLSIIDLYKNSNCDEITPYYAVFVMKKGEFIWNPIKKLSYFNKGKKILEDFIKNNPKNIEAKYVRWLVQKKAPSFVGYKENLKEDLKFIEKNIPISNINKDYKKVMLMNIQETKNE